MVVRQDSNPQPINRKSDVLLIVPPLHLPVKSPASDISKSLPFGREKLTGSIPGKKLSCYIEKVLQCIKNHKKLPDGKAVTS